MEYPIYTREMIPLESGGGVSVGGEAGVVVMSYNVLAECYAYDDRYPHCPEFARRWSYRSGQIVREIEHYSPDVVCLQELDHFQDLLPEMERLGYGGIYLKRSGSRLDGCAIFYKNDKVQFNHYVPIEFNDIANLHEDKFRFLKDNVAIAGLFSLKNGAQVFNEFIVATTHLQWDETLADVKLAQAEMLLDKIHEHFPTQTRMFVAGDFNSLPSSQVYNRFIGYSLKLKSAYASLGEPFTTPKMCMDYIFCTEDVTVTHALQPLPENLLGKSEDFPSPVFPSDHFPIMARFSFQEKK